MRYVSPKLDFPKDIIDDPREELSNLIKLYRQGLKYMVTFHVIDYDVNITKMLNLISRTLRSGGYCEVSVKNGDSKEPTVFNLDGDGTDRLDIVGVSIPKVK